MFIFHPGNNCHGSTDLYYDSCENYTRGLMEQSRILCGPIHIDWALVFSTSLNSSRWVMCKGLQKMDQHLLSCHVCLGFFFE